MFCLLLQLFFIAIVVVFMELLSIKLDFTGRFCALFKKGCSKVMFYMCSANTQSVLIIELQGHFLLIIYPMQCSHY